MKLLNRRSMEYEMRKENVFFVVGDDPALVFESSIKVYELYNHQRFTR